MNLYDKRGNKVGIVESLKKENLSVEEAGGLVSIILKGSTQEPYLFGSFKIKGKKLKGMYTEEELYWINYGRK